MVVIFTIFYYSWYLMCHKSASERVKSVGTCTSLKHSGILCTCLIFHGCERQWGRTSQILGFSLCFSIQERLHNLHVAHLACIVQGGPPASQARSGIIHRKSTGSKQILRHPTQRPWNQQHRNVQTKLSSSAIVLHNFFQNYSERCYADLTVYSLIFDTQTQVAAYIHPPWQCLLRHPGGLSKSLSCSLVRHLVVSQQWSYQSPVTQQPGSCWCAGMWGHATENLHLHSVVTISYECSVLCVILRNFKKNTSSYYILFTTIICSS